MKCQNLFSLKKKKKIECRQLQILLGTLRVKIRVVSISTLIIYIYYITDIFPNIQHEISHDIDDLHACKCDKSVIPWFCACTCDNELAGACALSHRTCALTMG